MRPKWLNLKKKQTTDKPVLEKKHATQMADFRTTLLKSKVQPTPVTTPVFPVAFPTFAFTFTTERKKNPEIIYILWNQKIFQPWYLQVRTKFQVDFTHLSERDRFFYIHNKLKNKILNQMQV